MDNTIRFGFWNYVESGVLKKEEVAEWKNALRSSDEFHV